MTTKNPELHTVPALNSNDLIALEFAESRWARATTNALSGEERGAIGMSYTDLGSTMVWLTSTQPDRWLYNRTIALGLRRPVNEADLDKIVATARASGIRQLVFGVHPESLPIDLGERLIARGATEGRVWLQVSRNAA